MTRMVRYSGIKRMAHVLKWPVDSYVQGVEFMVPMWRKEENSHTILFVVL
jgi:hypothetical protein